MIDRPLFSVPLNHVTQIEEVRMTERTVTAKTPEAHDVVRRDLRFDLADCDLRTWHPDGLHVSHFFNALSVFFPEGESFFIDSVRHYRDRIQSPSLAADVQGFL